ncbi:hypothetical protein GCM10027422_27640 [Hymenobacter arcticus]
MRYALALATSASILCTACSSPGAATKTTSAAPATAAAPAADPDGWVDIDLSTTVPKMPLVVKAPAGYAVVGKSPLGDVKLGVEGSAFDVDDVTAQGADFLKRQQDDVAKNSGMVFEKFVLEQPDGFIAQMGGSNYLPVRLVKVGGHTYMFSTIPLYALPSEEAAKKLYDMAALAKAK